MWRGELRHVVLALCVLGPVTLPLGSGFHTWKQGAGPDQGCHTSSRVSLADIANPSQPCFFLQDREMTRELVAAHLPRERTLPGDQLRDNVRHSAVPDAG